MNVEPLSRQVILEAVDHTDHLPPLPRVVSEIERELARDDPAPARVARIIEQDPALCAGVLRLANSALYARRTPVTDVVQAIGRLGLGETQRVVTAASVMGAWREVPGVDLERFWWHSVAVGLVSMQFARRVRAVLPRESTDSAFLAGLLHDIGALIVAQAFPEHTAELHREPLAEGESLADRELRVWGVDHGEIGATLAAGWNLPPVLREAMSFHHQPWLAAPDVTSLVQLVHVADFFCTNQGFGRRVDGCPGWLDRGAWDGLGLDLADVFPGLEEVQDRGAASHTWVTLLRAAKDESTFDGRS